MPTDRAAPSTRRAPLPGRLPSAPLSACADATTPPGPTASRIVLGLVVHLARVRLGWVGGWVGGRQASPTRTDVDHAAKEAALDRIGWVCGIASALDVPIVVTEEDADTNGPTAPQVRRHLPDSARVWRPMSVSRTPCSASRNCATSGCVPCRPCGPSTRRTPTWRTRPAFRGVRIGGAKGTRTPDLLHAMQTRYQLRHSPEPPSTGEDAEV